MLAVCANDHAVALDLNLMEFKKNENAQQDSNQFLVSENPMEYKRRATMSTREPQIDLGAYDSKSSSNSNNQLDLPGIGSGLTSSQIPRFVFQMPQSWVNSLSSHNSN